jgi:hypothetical protein
MTSEALTAPSRTVGFHLLTRYTAHPEGRLEGAWQKGELSSFPTRENWHRRNIFTSCLDFHLQLDKDLLIEPCMFWHNYVISSRLLLLGCSVVPSFSSSSVGYHTTKIQCQR